MAHKCFYSVICTQKAIDGNNYTMFGIMANDGARVVTVKDLSEDSRRVEELARRMNDAELEIQQLLEVIDDFMFSNYGFMVP